MTLPGKKKEECVLHELGLLMASYPELTAVRLDSVAKKVSFSFEEGAETGTIRKRIEEVVSRHRPGPLPDCAHDPWLVDCLLCELGRTRAMPAGIRLRTTSSEALIEKDGAERRFQRWLELPWRLLGTREMHLPEDEEELSAWKKSLGAAAACGVFAIVGFLLDRGAVVGSERHTWALAAYLLAYLAGGWHAAEDVWTLAKKRVVDIHFLMLAVAAGAAAIDHWDEGAVLLFLFSLSGALEELAMARTERAIRSLFRDAPTEAQLIEPSGDERAVPVESLVAGMTIRVRPNAIFPSDGEVIAGETEADEATLTGESVPVGKQPGDRVFAGTLNQWGSVDCRVARPAAESSVARIIRLIQEAQRSKAPSQRFAEKFSTGYTWAILLMTLGMFHYWWLVADVPAFADGSTTSALYRAMTLLVVASPCALVLSIPSAILAGIAAGARRGVLFRGGAAIEKLAGIDRVAMDKTGTLTTGRLRVREIVSIPPGREADLLARAGALSRHSSHPVSRAISAECHERGLSLPTPEHFRSLVGEGVEGLVAGEKSRLGRRALFSDGTWLAAIPAPRPGEIETLVESGDLRGRLLFTDTIRPESAGLLASLQRSGIRVTMLTGDRIEAAQEVAEQIGLEEVVAGLGPEEKVARIRAWSAAGERVAMIGDGVNDAPSLAASDVAVGMGVRGSDAALEQADVVLMEDRLENFLFAYRLSRRARRIIRQNLVISLGVIVILIAGALGSAVPLTIGVLGHEGSTVLVVLNSLRLMMTMTDGSNRPATA